MRFGVLRGFVMSLVCLMAAATAGAQVDRATITGTVRDSTGPRANVTVRATDVLLEAEIRGPHRSEWPLSVSRTAARRLLGQRFGRAARGRHRGDRCPR